MAVCCAHGWQPQASVQKAVDPKHIQPQAQRLGIQATHCSMLCTGLGWLLSIMCLVVGLQCFIIVSDCSVVGWLACCVVACLFACLIVCILLFGCLCLWWLVATWLDLLPSFRLVTIWQTQMCSSSFCVQVQKDDNVQSDWWQTIQSFAVAVSLLLQCSVMI
jgi:hypothetical protein